MAWQLDEIAISQLDELRRDVAALQRERGSRGEGSAARQAAEAEVAVSTAAAARELEAARCAGQAAMVPCAL